MAIIEASTDTWENNHYDLPCGLYFYYMNENIPSWSFKETSILGNCPSIQSVQFVPFIETKDLGLFKIPYDVERFGSINGLRPNLANTPYVYKISGMANKVKKLGSFKCYNVQKSVGGKRSWRNESRLYNYPYSFAMLSDNLNPPIEIKYHLCKTNDNDIKVRNTISDRCSYGLFIEGYKGDINGMLESMVSGDAHELPSSSSAYNQWFASNKNSMQQSIRNVSNQSFLSSSIAKQQYKMNNISEVGGMVGSLLNLQLGGVLNNGLGLLDNKMNMNNSIKQNNLNVSSAIESAMAQQKDLNSTPNTMLSMGSDVYYGLENGGKKVTLHRFGLTDEYYSRLGDYFAMYGYKQNKLMLPNIKSRYYYNYIKTIGINIRGYRIPRSQLEELRGIFDKGVTVWHIENNGVVVGDYSNDNYEI